MGWFDNMGATVDNIGTSVKDGLSKASHGGWNMSSLLGAGLGAFMMFSSGMGIVGVLMGLALGGVMGNFIGDGMGKMFGGDGESAGDLDHLRPPARQTSGPAQEQSMTLGHEQSMTLGKEPEPSMTLGSAAAAAKAAGISPATEAETARLQAVGNTEVKSPVVVER